MDIRLRELALQLAVASGDFSYDAVKTAELYYDFLTNDPDEVNDE